MIDLRTCKLKRGKLTDGKVFFEIRDMATDEFYLAIKFDTERQFKQWGAVLVESTRSDQQIRQVQILTPYQRQQEEKKKIEEL